MLLATFGIRKTIVSFDLAAVSGKVTGKLDNTNVKKRNPKKKTTLRARPSVDGEAKRQSILTMISQIPRGQVATYSLGMGYGYYLMSIRYLYWVQHLMPKPITTIHRFSNYYHNNNLY